MDLDKTKYEDIEDDAELVDYLRKVKSGKIKLKSAGNQDDLEWLLTRA